ncbi:MAG: GDP-fucose synthetase [Balneola sp.]|nr:GDP-fucose synthetase [Balneola sp.]MBE80545.1 GDP-fucose synthetase [Balneola sp.]|tara:strand:- start:174 stop:1133 length:960 start_codon:yes stop_codon:yes gene_type:complete
MDKQAKIYIAGHRGMVGSAIMENLKENGYSNFVTATSSELDLRNQQATNDFIAEHKPDVVIIAAARVGGILANNEYPWQFLYDNLMIEANLINVAHENDVQDLIFLGSSCIYPKMAPQPMKEEYLLTGPLEPTNQWYAVAKISGIKLCQALNQQYGRNYISMMPTNLYGPRDNFDLKTSHVLPAMIRKFHEAKKNDHATVPLWGSGSPMREFLHVDDLAESVRFVMEYEGKLEYDLINAGTGKDLTIKELAETVQEVVGHEGDINWDSSKPDGTPRKLMDVSRMSELGWESKIGLKTGIEDTYKWFLQNIESIKEVEIN